MAGNGHVSCIHVNVNTFISIF